MDGPFPLDRWYGRNNIFGPSLEGDLLKNILPVHPGESTLERDKFEETLFDWRTWKLAAQAGQLGLNLISAAVQHSSTRWIDSHLWLLERSLSWINQADCNEEGGALAFQHLAAQLAVALKPYAGEIKTKAGSR